MPKLEHSVCLCSALTRASKLTRVLSAPPPPLPPQLRTAYAGLYGAVPWWHLYVGLPDILRRYPQAEGLLWSNDDVVINYWNLAGANKVRGGGGSLPGGRVTGWVGGWAGGGRPG